MSRSTPKIIDRLRDPAARLSVAVILGLLLSMLLAGIFAGVPYAGDFFKGVRDVMPFVAITALVFVAVLIIWRAARDAARK